MKTKNYFNSKTKYRLVLSTVHMVYRLVNSTYNTKELLLRLTRLACHLLHAGSCWLYLLDSNTKKISLIAIFNGKINILQEGRADIKKVPQSYRAVALGETITQQRFIGLPLVADDNIGAIFIKREDRQPVFSGSDREIISVLAEQAVTAIKNLQLYEDQKQIVTDMIHSIGKLTERQTEISSIENPVFFKISKSLAEKLNMGQQEIEHLRYAGILRNVEFVDVPLEILSKRERLTREEFKVIRDHSAKSMELIKSVGFLKPVWPIIMHHHEKYDGTGYPSGLKKEQIPLGARIMAVVDAFEAMVCGRPYKKKLTVLESCEELKKNSGTQFDPRVVEAFEELRGQKKFRKYLSLIRR